MPNARIKIMIPAIEDSGSSLSALRYPFKSSISSLFSAKILYMMFLRSMWYSKNANITAAIYIDGVYNALMPCTFGVSCPLDDLLGSR